MGIQGKSGPILTSSTVRSRLRPAPSGESVYVKVKEGDIDSIIVACMARSCQLLDQSRLFIKALTGTKHSTRTQPKNDVLTWAERRKTRDASHLNFEGPDSHDDLYVCGNPCILERENIPTEVIRDRAECKPVYQILRKLWFRLNNFRSWTSLNPRPHFVLRGTRCHVCSVICFHWLSGLKIIGDYFDRSSTPANRYTHERELPTYCWTDRCSSFVSISKPTCGSHSDRRQRRNTKSKSTHMSMSVRQQHETTSHGIISCSFKYNYRES